MASAGAILERLSEGAELETVVIGPITRTHIVRYAGASGDFNPLHHDDEYARKLGNPGIFAMGMFPAGALATAVARWLGIERVRRYSVRFQSRVWPGDRLTLCGSVESKVVRDGAWTVVCALRVVNDAGEAVITGRAEAVYPLCAEPERDRPEGGPARQ